jgi:hypothetical protein
LAINVENGALEGANILGKRVQKMGSTKEEIIETLRVTCQIGGTHGFFTSAQLAKALF